MAKFLLSFSSVNFFNRTVNCIKLKVIVLNLDIYYLRILHEHSKQNWMLSPVVSVIPFC